ncbi:YbhB/YbcL family Raf kinase inhibitor-like protein [Robbsia sp. Bb-Pol-6]|uniref:YbhB/YbcL family Raf kinase inhibitor-like protein n=1 Tax=Robbsia betulipollinis TaxID=2981849 RepID=A0ABT3ZKR7_9BURK|nr:YbhB/YbcL family Raf kinase inhibitor-like protein [Robbsia betulipollinis]
MARFATRTVCLLLSLGCAAPALAEAPFSISSPDFFGGTLHPAQMYNHGGCKGGNQSPAVSWRGAPPGTAGFAITLHDIDTPGRGWWHWAVVNIPASIRQLNANASASGALAALGAVEARNDFDNDGYGGPCPPAGTVHRYVLTVYALKTTNLRVAPGRPAPFFEHEILDSALAHASIVVKNPPLP